MTRAELLKTAKPMRLTTRQVIATLDGTMTEIRIPIKFAIRNHAGAFLDSRYNEVKPPFQPGDIIYVRETWGKDKHGEYHYRANYPEHDCEPYPIWHQSIHMPKEAARIFLEVTGAKVERVHDITDEGAKAEGFNAGDKRSANSSIAVTAKQAFMWTWQAIYDKRQFQWLSNPWARCISFKVLT